jgi:3-phosphoshikimate 1-carboxyvinyltransferase
MQKKLLISMISSPIRRFFGKITVPGDKSISHRALMFSTMALGTTHIKNLLCGHDVMMTKNAMQALGGRITQNADNDFTVTGVGVGGLKEPEHILDFGNAGTGSRLTMGICSTYDFTTFFAGDESLSKRPMARILDPLSLFGAKSYARIGGRLPLALVGAKNPVPVTYNSPVASAQVKSAVLLAGLNTAGDTKIIEDIKTRDHTEKMLSHFGAKIETVTENNRYIACLQGYPILKAKDIIVPADPSSAAFAIVAAIITPDSEITVTNVLLNPERTGLLTALIAMGADITIDNTRTEGGESVGDITAKSSQLQGIVVNSDNAASMIDEYPILCIAAACAKGTTIMRGIEELRVKESDRISAMTKGLVKIGVSVTEHHDGWEITGGDISGHNPDDMIETFMDHRIAMSFLIAGSVSKKPIMIDDGAFIATSFPNFTALMNECGLHIESVDSEKCKSS